MTMRFAPWVAPRAKTGPNCAPPGHNFSPSVLNSAPTCLKAMLWSSRCPFRLLKASEELSVDGFHHPGRPQTDPRQIADGCALPSRRDRPWAKRTVVANVAEPSRRENPQLL
jgi:hypothetical protein